MRKITAFLLVIVALMGCTPTEKLKYSINTPDSRNVYNSERTVKRIQPYDYLYIKLYSLDPKTASIFNGTEQYGQTNEQLQSYEVDDEGYIFFPFVGRILVRDLTIEEAQKALEKELSNYLTNISLRVRFVSNKITVIGEVKNPGNHRFYDEKITIFQALGLAGDISTYGDKTNVTLLREKDTKIKYTYLDLTDKTIVESPDYFLQPNDILIINPVKQKYRTLQDRSVFQIVISAVSATATLLIGIATITR